MKKIFDFLLLNTVIFRRPVRSRTGFAFLIFFTGLVMVLKYSIRTGTLIDDFNTIILDLALSVFTGVFALVAFCWPISDFLISLDPEVERFHLNIKRIKLGKGFLYGVILTGAVEGIIIFLLTFIDSVLLSRVLMHITAALASIWAGGIISRCSFVVFEKAGEKKQRKYIVFIINTIWYYVIVNLAINSIIRLVMLVSR